MLIERPPSTDTFMLAARESSSPALSSIVAMVPLAAGSPFAYSRTAVMRPPISAGPIRTLAGAGIADARFMFNYSKAHSPLRRTVTIEDVGGSALYLLSDLSSGVTGEIHYVDAGYNVVGMPRSENLQSGESTRADEYPA